MLTVRIQEKNHSESIMVLKLKDGQESDSYRKETGRNKCDTWIKKEDRFLYRKDKLPMLT